MSSITLTKIGVTITMPQGMWWSDELVWQPIVRTETTSATGALIVQEGVRAYGRPVTLDQPAERAAYMNRADCDMLQAWASELNARMQLSIFGVTHWVRWRGEHAFTAVPLYPFLTDQSTDLFAPVLRLVTCPAP